MRSESSADQFVGHFANPAIPLWASLRAVSQKTVNGKVSRTKLSSLPVDSASGRGRTSSGVRSSVRGVVGKGRRGAGLRGRKFGEELEVSNDSEFKTGLASGIGEAAATQE
jgi:hypothetical protein